MKKSLFAFREGELNPIYITQLTQKDLNEYQNILQVINLQNAWFDIMECQEDKGDMKQEIFYSSLTDREYKYKEGMVFEPIV